MRLANKAQLRNTLKKLDAVGRGSGDAHDRATRAQEALDFLAVLTGLKPVLMLGRGYDDPRWLKGALQVAVDLRLHVIEGPYWDAVPAPAELPEWYLDHARAAFAGFRAHYVCKARATADEVAAICRSGTPTVEDEARLLGYPACCVAAHYARSLDYRRAWLAILEREAAGNAAEMQRLLAEGAPLAPASDAERDRLSAAMTVHTAPFTSINMCESCRVSADGPARRLSKRYAELARAVDPGLARALAAASMMAGAA